MYKYLQDFFSTSGKHKSKIHDMPEKKHDEFKHNVQDADSPIYLVLIHMIGCGYCKRILQPSDEGDSPIWTQIQKQNPHVNFIEIERTIYENGDFKKELGGIFNGQNGDKIISKLHVSTGYPTLFYVNAINGNVKEIKSPIEVDSMTKMLEFHVKRNVKSSSSIVSSSSRKRKMLPTPNSRINKKPRTMKTMKAIKTRTRTRTIKRNSGGSNKKSK